MVKVRVTSWVIHHAYESPHKVQGCVCVCGSTNNFAGLELDLRNTPASK